MKVSSFVSIVATRASGTLIVTGYFQPWPTVEDLQESKTAFRAISV
jgi:hypothetical protein